MAEPTIPLPKWAEVDVTDASGRINVQEPPDAEKDAGWASRDFMPRQWVNWLGRSCFRWLTYFRAENIARLAELATLRTNIVAWANHMIRQAVNSDAQYGNFTEAVEDDWKRVTDTVAKDSQLLYCKLVGYNSSNVVTTTGPSREVLFQQHTYNRLVSIRVPMTSLLAISGASGTSYVKLVQADGSDLPSEYLPASGVKHVALVPALISLDQSSYALLTATSTDIRFTQGPGGGLALNDVTFGLDGQTISFMRV